MADVHDHAPDRGCSGLSGWRVAEVGVDASWRQLWGSLGCAGLLLHWQFGIDRLAWDANDLVNFGVVLAICWLITWRAWPAVEIMWAFFTSPEARLAYRPTWPHVLGALGLGLVLPIATAIPLLLADQASDVDLGARTRGGLLLAVICYISWPAIVMKWRQVRIRTS